METGEQAVVVRVRPAQSSKTSSSSTSRPGCTSSFGTTWPALALGGVCQHVATAEVTHCPALKFTTTGRASDAGTDCSIGDLIGPGHPDGVRIARPMPWTIEARAKALLSATYRTEHDVLSGPPTPTTPATKPGGDETRTTIGSQPARSAKYRGFDPVSLTRAKSHTYQSRQTRPPNSGRIQPQEGWGLCPLDPGLIGLQQGYTDLGFSNGGSQVTKS